MTHPLIGPASPFSDSRETFCKSGTDGSNPVPSSSESANFQYLSVGVISQRGRHDGSRRRSSRLPVSTARTARLNHGRAPDRRAGVAERSRFRADGGQRWQVVATFVPVALACIACRGGYDEASVVMRATVPVPFCLWLG